MEKAFQIKQLGSFKKGTTKCTTGSRCGWVGRLGRSLLQRGVFPRNVDRERAGVAHQSQGACVSQEVCGGDDAAWRQDQHLLGFTHSCSLHKQNGRHKISSSVQDCLGAVGCCFGKARLVDCHLVTQRSEPTGRLAFKVCNRYLGGISASSGDSNVVGQVVHSCSGPLCKLEVPRCDQVLQLVSRQQGCAEGCILPGEVARQGVLLSSSSFGQHGLGEDQKRQGQEGNSGASTVANEHLVVSAAGDVGGGTSEPGVLQDDPVISIERQAAVSAPSDGLFGVRDGVALTNEAKELLSLDIRSGTKNVYTARFNHFSTYCESIGVDPQHCSENVIVNFLTMLKTKFGYKYQTIAGYRSAISKYHGGLDGVPVGQAKHVKRVTKAVFNVSPPLAKYADIWPVDKLLAFLGTLYPHHDLTDFQLGMKCLTLISLTSISRSSTLALLGPGVQILGDQVVFGPSGAVQTLSSKAP